MQWVFLNISTKGVQEYKSFGSEHFGQRSFFSIINKIQDTEDPAGGKKWTRNMKSLSGTVKK
jgi:hypothetical protein